MRISVIQGNDFNENIDEKLKNDIEFQKAVHKTIDMIDIIICCWQVVWKQFVTNILQLKLFFNKLSFTICSNFGMDINMHFSWDEKRRVQQFALSNGINLLIYWFIIIIIQHIYICYFIWLIDFLLNKNLSCIIKLL